MKYISEKSSYTLKKMKRVTNHVNTYLTWIVHILFVDFVMVAAITPCGKKGNHAMLNHSNSLSILIIFDKLISFSVISGLLQKINLCTRSQTMQFSFRKAWFVQ